jgi:hypothetical protein
MNDFNNIMMQRLIQEDSDRDTDIPQNNYDSLRKDRLFMTDDENDSVYAAPPMANDEKNHCYK